MADVAELKGRIKSLQSASRDKVTVCMVRCFTSNLAAICQDIHDALWWLKRNVIATESLLRVSVAYSCFPLSSFSLTAHPIPGNKGGLSCRQTANT